MSRRTLPTLRIRQPCEKVWKSTFRLLLDRSCKGANLGSMAVLVIHDHAAQAILGHSEKSLRVFDAAKTRWSEGELLVSSVLDVFEKGSRISMWTHLGVRTTNDHIRSDSDKNVDSMLVGRPKISQHVFGYYPHTFGEQNDL